MKRVATTANSRYGYAFSTDTAALQYDTFIKTGSNNGVVLVSLLLTLNIFHTLF